MPIQNSVRLQPSLRLEGRDKNNRIIEDHWRHTSNRAIIREIITRRVAQIIFVVPTILVGRSKSYLPNRYSYLPNTFLYIHNFTWIFVFPVNPNRVARGLTTFLADTIGINVFPLTVTLANHPGLRHTIGHSNVISVDCEWTVYFGRLP